MQKQIYGEGILLKTSFQTKLSRPRSKNLIMRPQTDWRHENQAFYMRYITDVELFGSILFYYLVVH